jgi:hypothetical protein
MVLTLQAYAAYNMNQLSLYVLLMEWTNQTDVVYSMNPSNVHCLQSLTIKLVFFTVLIIERTLFT